MDEIVIIYDLEIDKEIRLYILREGLTVVESRLWHNSTIAIRIKCSFREAINLVVSLKKENFGKFITI